MLTINPALSWLIQKEAMGYGYSNTRMMPLKKANALLDRRIKHREEVKARAAKMMVELQMGKKKMPPPVESLPLTYYESYCFLNAYINMNEAYKHLNLRMKVGSVGFNDFFEYGGKGWGLQEFKARVQGNAQDAHAWLEDKDGNVYDYIYDWYNDIALINSNKPLGITGLIEGKSKEDLRGLGIDYQEAPSDAVCWIILHQSKSIKSKYEALKTGKSMWYAEGTIAYIINA